MKTRNLVGLAAAVVLLCSCIPSVHPFYTTKDVVFDARLLGAWQEKDKASDPDIWTFEKGDDQGYKLTVLEQGKQGQFAGHLFKLKQEYFLDLIPAECNYATNQADLVAASMFPGHLLMRVQWDPDLKLAISNFDWLGKYLEKEPKALAHYVESKQMVLTAETSELQAFVMKHLDDLFEKASPMVRKGSSSPPR